MDHDTLQQLMEDGLTIEQAKNIIQASNHKDIKIQFDVGNEEKIQEIFNVCEQQNADRKNNLSKKHIKLLLMILNNIIKHPNKDIYKSINPQKLASKTCNDDMCLYILKQAGFKLNHNASRLIFYDKQYDQLQSVYFNLLKMCVCDYHEYPSGSSQNVNQLNSKHLLHHNTLYFDKAVLQLMGGVCELQQCLCLKNIANVLLFYNSY
eukprot:173886_1